MAYFVVWDEVSSCRRGIDPREAWESVVQPCIITRWSASRAEIYGAKSAGRALIISTPKGYNYFYEMYNKREKDNAWKAYHYDYTKSPFLDPVEIERIKGDIDPIKFASEYLASFKESGNNLFYMFDRNKHVSQDIPYFRAPEGDDKGEDIHVSIDFNVGIQASTAWAIRGKQMFALDEFKGHPDTETLATVLATKYRGHRIYAYPDPSGRARKPSAPVGRTDFSILEAAGIRCLARQKAPPIVDSVNAVNRMLETASGANNMYYHPRCQGSIQSMERTKWVDNNPDLATIDKSEGVEHFSDGTRYITEYMFPVHTGTSRVSRGFNF